MNEFIDSISTVGFPVIMCIMLYKNQTKQLNEITKQLLTTLTQLVSCQKLGMEEKEDD